MYVHISVERALISGKVKRKAFKMLNSIGLKRDLLFTKKRDIHTLSDISTGCKKEPCLVALIRSFQKGVIRNESSQVAETPGVPCSIFGSLLFV